MRVCLFLNVIYLRLRAESFRPLNINAIFFLNTVMLLSYLFLIMLSLVACNGTSPVTVGMSR